MNLEFIDIGARVGVFFIPFLFALCFHEYAHGWVAKLRGDNTAELMGRLSMNPLVHMDPLGTLILPLLSIALNSPIFFGWAKPVPVNPRNFKNIRNDMFWVALAGPLSNVLLAFIATFVMATAVRLLGNYSTLNAIVKILDVFIMTNLFLAVFNLIPLHPLDGGKVLARFLPARANYFLEKNESTTSLILMILVMSGALRIISGPVIELRMWLINLATAGVGGIG